MTHPQPRAKARSAEDRKRSSARVHRPRVRLARFLLLVAVVLAAIFVPRLFQRHAPPMTPLQARIVSYAKSQLGYRTDPPNSYCNKFSYFWGSGSADCPAGELDEEWCADFAAWAWHKAGVVFTYGYRPGDINGAAVSFYEWALAHDAWHPAHGYAAAPGDVAVYGLVLGPDPSAAHVAVVTDDPPGQEGPDVVNGDGDRTGFSVVETGEDQVRAAAGGVRSPLSGYVSPPSPPPRARHSGT